MMAMLSPTDETPDTQDALDGRTLAGTGARRFSLRSVIGRSGLQRVDSGAAAINVAQPDLRSSPSALKVRRIIDTQNAAFGRELVFNAALDGLFPTTAKGRHPAAEHEARVSMQLRELSAATAYPAQRTFVRASAALINNPAIDWLPASAQVFALDFAGVPDDALIARCRMLRGRGFSFALAAYTGLDERSRPLWSMLDIIEIRADENDERKCRELAGSLARLPVKLLASGVSSPEQLVHCRRAGFHLFSGDQIAPLETLAARWLTVSQPALVRLLALIAERAAWTRIEDACKREPALVYNLLHLARQASRQSAQTTLTLRQALTQLDEHGLRCWLELQLTALAQSSGDSALEHAHAERCLQLASLGGRLLELFVHRLEPGDDDLAQAAYLAGSLSLMPAALSLPLRELVQDLPVQPEVSRALLHHEGILGQCLAVLDHFDKRDATACDQQIRQISRGKLGYTDLQACFAEALAWLTQSAG